MIPRMLMSITGTPCACRIDLVASSGLIVGPGPRSCTDLPETPDEPIAYNLLAGGSRLEHIEVRRNDQVFLDALGADRIPDPTTAGDFCRRFTEGDVQSLMDIVNETRLRVWKQQPEEFFDEAFIDADGTIAPSDGWCKQGVDIAYNGIWGYHPLVVSLANTAEPLFLVNRSGNRPSHEHADIYLDKAAALCRRAGFRKITFRGDTKFTQ